MTEQTKQESSQGAIDPHLRVAASTAFVQAWQNARHIRIERIWFTNVYTAVVGGGLAFFATTQWGSATQAPKSIGLLVLVLFSIVSIMSSIRLIADLRTSTAALKRLVNESGMGQSVSLADLPHGFGASLPLRSVAPILCSLTIASLVVFLFVHVQGVWG